MRAHRHAADAAPERGDDELVEVRRTFDAETGCADFAQRVLRFAPGCSGERLDAARDEVLYVLSGSAELAFGGEIRRVREGSSVYVAAGTPWSAASEEGFEALSVLVADPLPGRAAHAVIEVGEEDARSATAGRQFRLGATPEVGCASVTQFVGLIPPGRSPDHFHTYDEVVYVAGGKGALHVGAEEAPLSPGSCVHLPARVVHSLENTGDEAMTVVGVFRPAGSPAEAYYPNGALAAVPEE